MLNNFNTQTKLLKKAMDADVSLLFKDMFSVVETEPVDKRQQYFIEEIRNLSNSLKDTVLDNSEKKPELKLNKEIQKFLQETIKKQIVEEKMNASKYDNFDNKLKNIMQEAKIVKADIIEQEKEQPKKSTSKIKDEANSNSVEVDKTTNYKIESAIDVKRIADEKSRQASPVSQNLLNAIAKVNKKLGKVEKEKTSSSIVEKEIKNSAIDEAEYERQRVSVKNDDLKKPYLSVNQLKETYQQKGNVNKSSESIAKLNNLVTEKAQISKILQRQGNLESHKNDKADASESKIFAVQKNISTISTQKSPDYRKAVDIKIHSLLKFDSTKLNNIKQVESKQHYVQKLLEQSNTDVIENKSETKSIKLRDMLSDQLKNQASKEIAQQIQNVINMKSSNDIQEKKDVQEKKQDVKSTQESIRSTVELNEKLQAGLLNKALTKAVDKQMTSAADQEAGNVNHSQNNQIQSAEIANEGIHKPIPEELQTAIQWMAEEEVENKLVELLSRQAKLRGVDLS